jgi:hypothetical protein
MKSQRYPKPLCIRDVGSFCNCPRCESQTAVDRAAYVWRYHKGSRWARDHLQRLVVNRWLTQSQFDQIVKPVEQLSFDF